MLMTKSVVGILILFFNLVAFADPQKKRCAFLLVVDNSARSLAPEREYVYPRFLVSRLFNGIVHQAYGKGDRSVFTSRVQVATGASTPGRPGEATVLLSLRTAPEERVVRFNTRALEFIPTSAQAELWIDIFAQPNVAPVPGLPFGSRDLSAPLSTSSLSDLLRSSRFLDVSDIKSVLNRAAQEFGVSTIDQLERIKVGKESSWQFKIAIKLEALTEAEFAVLLNAVIDRIQERALADDDQVPQFIQ